MYSYEETEDDGFSILDTDETNLAYVELEGMAEELVQHLNHQQEGPYQYDFDDIATYEIRTRTGTLIAEVDNEETAEGLLTHLNR